MSSTDAARRLRARRRFLWRLGLVAVLAFAGRALYIVTVTQHERFPESVTTGPQGLVRSLDEAWYAGVAHSLKNGDLFRPVVMLSPQAETALHPPLTAVAFVPGALVDSELTMRFTAALAGTGVVLLVGLLARRLAGDRAGLTAAAIAAVYPNLWMHDGLLMSETFATLSTAAAVIGAYAVIRKPTWRTAAALGLATGLAVLARGELVLLVPVLVLPVILTLRQPVPAAQRIRLLSVSLAAVMLTVAPWVVYNLTRFDKPVFLSTGDGPALVGTYCDLAYSGEFFGFYSAGCTTPVSGDESVQSAHHRSQGLTYLTHHLGRLPIVVTARVGRIWGIYRPLQTARLAEGEGRPLTASLVGWAMSWPLIALSVAGALQLRRRGLPVLPLVAPIVVVTLNAAAFYGNLRFRTPAEVSLVALAAIGASAAGRIRDDSYTDVCTNRREFEVRSVSRRPR